MEKRRVREVEDIITHRINERKKQYLVKWVGYPSSENSWVNEADMNAPQLLTIITQEAP